MRALARVAAGSRGCGAHAAPVPALNGSLVAGRRQIALAVLAGAMAASGQAPLSALWLALPGFALLLGLVARAPSARNAAFRAWWGGLGHFALALAWLVQPFLIDPVRYAWMAPFGLLAMAGGLAAFWALAAAVAWRAGGTVGGRLAALAFALTGAELARTWLFTGFPWALVGHVWIGWPGMQLAAWAGAGGLSLAALAVAALLAGGRPAGWLAALVLAGAVTGAGRWRQAEPLPADRAVTVRLVQPDIPQRMKWDPDTAAQTFDTLLALTATPAGASGAPDLVIWPESALPYWLDDAGMLLAEVSDAAGGVPVLVGANRGLDDGDSLRAWNSLAEVGPGGAVEAVYDKHHLVPFGEYLPFQGILSHIGLRAFTARAGFGFTAGPGPRLLDLGRVGRALPLICYEAIFPQDIRAAPARPDWLMQVTNDAWFGTLQGPQQHLAQARLRAVEFGLPLLRAANTGISAVIDARGGVRRMLALGERGVIDAALPGALPPTLYARTGDLPLVLLLLVALGGIALSRRRE